MISSINAFFKERSSFQVTTACLFLIFILAAMDHITGYELSFSIFYLLPIAFATWYAGLYHGALLSIVSAFVWLIVDITAGHHYSRSIILLWNAGVRFLFFIVTAWLLTTVRAQLEKERSMARLDGLTGVMNGLAFVESAQTIFRIADRFKRSTAIGYIDLDNFKSVNDTWGHAEGDQVLKTVASILLTSVRKADLVGRLGGDEFVVLLPETTCSGAGTVFENIRETFSKKAEEQGWPIGVSIGVAVFLTAPSSLNEAIRFADTLMYRVKNSGKNRILIEEVGRPEIIGRHSNGENPRNPRGTIPEAPHQ
ncbi:GGDEF domain-containing protein [uncultured Desulfosarcina sp.]|uniref:GGDEF domain-containing protein n=1 Tax=uncultured Desulfosarcina sp. TaxID=218289 RepID=UPI0029C6DF60|nr:GGDEF domain-containing protein [uncultured Desulfosarcina sp.]